MRSVERSAARVSVLDLPVSSVAGFAASARCARKKVFISTSAGWMFLIGRMKSSSLPQAGFS